MKKLLLVVSVMFLFGITDIETVKANDFESNMAYYEKICYNATSAQENREVCEKFQQYINNKISDDKKELESLQGEIKDLQSNIVTYAAKVKEYEARIEELQRQINLLNNSIKELEVEIVKLEEDIAIREENIMRIDREIQERMVSMQSFASINTMVDFVMGASSFSDLMRRIEGLKDIQAYDNEQMALLESEINLLNEDKEKLEFSKNSLEENRKAVEESKTVANGYKAKAEEILKEYYRQKAILEEKESQMLQDIESVRNKLKLISEALNNIVASKGWTLPLRSGTFRVSANTWYYPQSFGGGIHLGTDFAAPLGTSIYAPANGVVVFSADNCPNVGYLTDRCGYPGNPGGGNQSYLIVRVEDKTYAIKLLHMKKGTLRPSGTLVEAGEKVGEVASSGNSTGNHLHLEIFLLGTESVNYYAQNWNGDLSFGAGVGSVGIRRTCENTGYVAPCRIRPESVFGV